MSENNSVLNPKSRYVSGGTTEVGEDTLEWWERTPLASSPDDSPYTIERKFAGRLDLIAALFLGEPRYWWIIAQYNSVLDPFDEIVEGSIIYIPSAERIETILSGGVVGGVASTRQIPISILPIV